MRHGTRKFPDLIVSSALVDVSLEVRVGRSGRPGGVRSEVSVALDVRVEITKEVLAQPPRQTGTPGVQNSLPVVESVVEDSRVRVVVVLCRLRQCSDLIEQ